MLAPAIVTTVDESPPVQWTVTPAGAIDHFKIVGIGDHQIRYRIQRAGERPNVSAARAAKRVMASGEIGIRNIVRIV